MGKGSSGGDSPDTVGAARETGEQARKLNEAQTYANRPNQNNAWGSTNWSNAPTWDQSTGQYVNNWTQNETLNPKMQEQLDAQMNIGMGRSNLAQGMMGRVWDDQSAPMDFDQFGKPIGMDGDTSSIRQEAEDAAYGRSTARLDPQFEGRESSLLNKLRNQGLSAGDQAYDSAMSNFGNERTDAYEMARLGATGEGRQESGQMFDQRSQENQLANQLREQGINEEMFKRGYSLDEMNKMLEGQGIAGGPPTSGGQTETLSSKSLGGG